MKKWLNSNYSAINHHGGRQVKGGLGQGDLIWTRLIQNCIYSGPSGITFFTLSLCRSHMESETIIFLLFHIASVFPIACRVLDDICTMFHKCKSCTYQQNLAYSTNLNICVFHSTVLPLVTDYSVHVKINSTPVHRFCLPLKQAGINVSFLSLAQLAKLR